MLQRVTVFGVHTHLLWSCLSETCVGCTVTYIVVIIPVQLVSLYIMLSTTKQVEIPGTKGKPPTTVDRDDGIDKVSIMYFSLFSFCNSNSCS
jgi:hypothetical protein